MSDESKAFNVAIKTSADLAAAQDLEESLSRQILKAKLVGDEFGDLEEKLHRVREAMAAFRETSDGSEKKLSFFNLRSLELKKLIRELAVDFPIAGRAAAFFMNPLVTGISLAIGAFALAKRHLDDWNKALDDAAARAAQRDFLPGFEAAEAALRDGARDAVAFKDSLKQIGTEAKTADEQLGAMITKIREMQTQRAALIDAQLGLKLAQINLAEQQGLSPAAADVQRFQAQGESARRQEENRRAAEAAQLATQQNAYDNAKLRQPGLVAAAQSATQAAAEAAAKTAKSQADLDQQKKAAADAESRGVTHAQLNEAVEKARAEFETQKQYIESRGGRVEDQPYYSRVRRAGRSLDEAESALREFDLRQKLIKQLEEEVQARQIAYKQRADEATAAQAAATGNQKFIATQGTALPESRAGVAAQQANREQVGALGNQQRATELAGSLNKALQDDSQRLQALLTQMLEAAQNGTGISSQLAGQVNALKKDQEAIRAQLEKLSRQIR